MEYLQEGLRRIEARMMEALEMKARATSLADKLAAEEAFQWAKMSRDVFLELQVLRLTDDKHLRPYEPSHS